MDTCSNDSLKLDYLNVLLSEIERNHFEEHLAACTECRREVERLRKTAAAIAELKPPSVPEAWADNAKTRLRTKSPSLMTAAAAEPAPGRSRTNIFLYALISAGVTAVLVLLSWWVLGGSVQRWLPGLSTAGLGIAAPRTARTIDLAIKVLSLASLMFVPSIIDNIYLLVRRGSRRTSPGSSAVFLAL